MKRRVSQAPAPALSTSVRGLLIHGWGEGRREHGSDAPLEPYLLDDAALRELWRLHRGALLAEAESLGVVPWGRHFDEQAVP